MKTVLPQRLDGLAADLQLFTAFAGTDIVEYSGSYT